MAISIFHDIETLKNRSIADIKTRAMRMINPTPQIISSALQRNLYTFLISPPGSR
jgi:hypothetical protein